ALASRRALSDSSLVTTSRHWANCSRSVVSTVVSDVPTVSSPDMGQQSLSCAHRLGLGLGQLPLERRHRSAQNGDLRVERRTGGPAPAKRRRVARHSPTDSAHPLELGPQQTALLIESLGERESGRGILHLLPLP